VPGPLKIAQPFQHFSFLGALGQGLGVSDHLLDGSCEFLIRRIVRGSAVTVLLIATRLCDPRQPRYLVSAWLVYQCIVGLANVRFPPKAGIGLAASLRC
jgi:hypothetical protein